MMDLQIADRFVQLPNSNVFQDKKVPFCYLLVLPMMDRWRQILCVLSEEPNAHNAGGTDFNKSADLFGLMAKQTKQRAKGNKVRVKINRTGRT